MRPQGIHMEDFGIGSYEFWGCRGCDVNWQLVDDDDECYDPQYPYYYENDGYEYFIKDDDVFHWLVEHYPEFYVADEEDKEDCLLGKWKGYCDGYEFSHHYDELGIHKFVYDEYFPEGATYS